MSLSKDVKQEVEDNNSSSMSSWNGWNDGKMIDDCVGVLLSYLSLEDKFRLESVSRQWQRKIFWSIGYLSVTKDNNNSCLVGDMNGNILSKSISPDVLKIIFKKCDNIE